jgi:hypothetical protein
VRKDGWISLGLFALGAIAIGVIFHRVFEAFPGFGDEMNYLFQAKIFASGHLSVPEPPDPQFFKVAWMDLFGTDGRIWGFHPPGNSVLLMLGTLVGMPDVTIPIVGGLLLVALYLFALEVLPDRRFALLCVLVGATSHYFLSLASSYMAHAPSALCLTLGSFCVLRFTKGGRAALLPAGAAAFGAVSHKAGVGRAPRPAHRDPRAREVPQAPSGTYALAIDPRGPVPASGIFVHARHLGKGTRPTRSRARDGTDHLGAPRQGPGDAREEPLPNVNEYQHRVHSFGILGNLLPALPAALPGPPLRSRYLIFLYGSFLFFAVGHSVLHWHGWKWSRACSTTSRSSSTSCRAWASPSVRAFDARPRRSAPWLAPLVLPWLGRPEGPARAVRHGVRGLQHPPWASSTRCRKGIHEAIVLFRNEEMYTCYMPQNTAVRRRRGVRQYVGALENYRLLARFPKKQVFYSARGDDPPAPDELSSARTSRRWRRP